MVGIQMGKTKVFLKHYAFDALEQLRDRKLSETTIKIQSIYRMRLYKRFYEMLVYSLYAIQKVWRGFAVKLMLCELKHNRVGTIIQALWHRYALYSRYSLICFVSSWCQCVWKRFVCMRKYFELRKISKVIIIQNIWRQTKDIQLYITLRFIVSIVQILFRAKVSREELKRLKLEARSLSFVMTERDRLKKEAEIMKYQLEEVRCEGKENKWKAKNRAFTEAQRLAEEQFRLKSLEMEKEMANWKLRLDDAQAREHELKSLNSELNDRVIYLENKLTKHENSKANMFMESSSMIKKRSRENDIIFYDLSPQVCSHSFSPGETEVMNKLSKSVFKEHVKNEKKTDINSNIINVDNKSCLKTLKRFTEESSQIENWDEFYGRKPSLGGFSHKSIQHNYTPKRKYQNMNDNEGLNYDWRSNGTDLTEFDDSWSDDLPRTIKNENIDTPIHIALRAFDDEALTEAIQNTDDVATDINRRGHDGQTPLHIAVVNSNIASAEYLLSNQSVANAQDKDGNTPLHYAEHFSIVELLLTVGRANPNIPNGIGFCPLHLAVQRKDIQSVKCLIEYNADVNVADDKMWVTPIHLVMLKSGFEYSFSHAFSSITLFSNLSPEVEIAAIFCQLATKSHVDFNYQDRNGNTPMHYATTSYFSDAGNLISLLLKNGGSPNKINIRGQTPLHLLLHNTNLRAFDFYEDILLMMLNYGANTNIPSLSGCTPIHLALYHQDINSAIQLLQKGAQLHLPWKIPSNWKVHWSETCDVNIVLCLDMICDDTVLNRIITSVSCEQTFAPSSSKCLHCKSRFTKFGRQYHCWHCGSLVCSKCSPNKLESKYFPSYCTSVHLRQEISRICLICQERVLSRM